MDKKPGATGKFPKGKLCEADEGELRIRFAVDGSGNVIIEFGKSVSWIGFDPKSAIDFAYKLLHTAIEAQARARMH